MSSVFIILSKLSALLSSRVALGCSVPSYATVLLVRLCYVSYVILCFAVLCYSAVLLYAMFKRWCFVLCSSR